MPKTIKELLRERFAPPSVLFDSDEYPKNKQYVKWLNTKWYSQDELDKAVNDMLLYRVEMKIKEIFNECIPKPLRESMKLMTIGEYQNTLEQLQKELNQNVHVLLQAHSGRRWGDYTPDTAVTEYRAMLKPILHEKIDTVFAKFMIAPFGRGECSIDDSKQRIKGDI